MFSSSGLLFVMFKVPARRTGQVDTKGAACRGELSQVNPRFRRTGATNDHRQRILFVFTIGTRAAFCLSRVGLLVIAGANAVSITPAQAVLSAPPQ